MVMSYPYMVIPYTYIEKLKQFETLRLFKTKPDVLSLYKITKYLNIKMFATEIKL